MLTKDDLENLYQLEGEIRDIERQIEKLHKPASFVGDTVRDYRSGQGVPMTIRGYSENRYRKESKLLSKYEKKLEKANTEKERLEEELDNIKDTEIRRIIRLRYFERLPWEAVASRIGPDKTEDSVRKKLERALKEI